jgi:hypothetical protein
MMQRRQRIDFEILDCALNRATHREGYITAVRGFMQQLRQLFPDIETREFMDACKALAAEGALDISLVVAGGARTYDGKDDDAFFYDAKALLLLRRGPGSNSYFRRLSALIDVPSGVKRPPGG